MCRFKKELENLDGERIFAVIFKKRQILYFPLWNNSHSFLRWEVMSQWVQQGMGCKVPGFIFAVNLFTWRFFSCLPYSVCLFGPTDSQT